MSGLKKLMGLDVEVPQIELRRIESLVGYHNNARTHSVGQREQIRASFRKFGWTNPVLADAMGIVAGHGRCESAREMYEAGEQINFPNGTPIPIGLVPVIDCTGWNAEMRRAYILADNKLALNAGWDEDLLSLELTDLADAGFDLSVIGFSTDELDALLNDVPPLDELPKLPDGDKDPFEQMTFTLHHTQAEQVQIALALAANQGPFDSDNPNSNGNALARICETYLTRVRPSALEPGADDGDPF